jgi:hypothetical protein
MNGTTALIEPGNGAVSVQQVRHQISVIRLLHSSMQPVLCMRSSHLGSARAGATGRSSQPPLWAAPPGGPATSHRCCRSACTSGRQSESKAAEHSTIIQLRELGDVSSEHSCRLRVGMLGGFATAGALVPA